MRKGTILTILIFFQKPNDGSEKIDWRFDEKITRLFYPLPVQTQHHGSARFSCIRYIQHTFRKKRVTTVRSREVIKIDRIEFGSDFILFVMFAQRVIGNPGKVWKFKIIDKE